MFTNSRKKVYMSLAALMLMVLALGGAATNTQAADTMWDARYWNNRDFSGNPVLQRAESSLNYDWGNGSPAPGIVNADNFTARWRQVIYFPASSYRFTATTDDGMRVWVDGVLIIDSWWDSQVHSVSGDIYLNTGDHEVKVDYYEAGGGAIARLSWAPFGGPAPAPVANWRGEYFNNMTLAGAPALVRDDASITFEWGTNSPAWNVVASDQFSVRWTRNQSFDQGRWRFTVIADDGARLWVNNQLLIDQWHDSISGAYTAEIDLPGGPVPMKMEFYENMGGAMARLGWERPVGGGIYNWRGEYFNNRDLSGSPALVRDDAQINFNWGNGSPAQGIVNVDNFSVRWTRPLSFNAGRYRFSLNSDDGVRLWVNNQQIINAWYDHAPLLLSGDIDLPGGAVPVRVEYYDATAGAQVQFSWTQVGSTPPPPPPPPPAPTTANGVVQSARLNVRYGPGFQYGVITQLVRGQSVTLAGQRTADNKWVMINWSGSTAWVSGLPAYLWTSVPVSNLSVWNGTVPGTGGPVTEGSATVASVDFLNVRTGPGVSYPVIRAMPSGSVVTMIGRNTASTWAKVRLADSAVGWMSAAYLIKSVPMSTLPVAN